MFSVITNIYNKKTKRSTLLKFFTATRKLKTFSLTTRDVRCVCTTGDTVHIGTILKLLPHTRQHVDFFNFPVAVKNSVKVGPLVLLL